MTVYLDCVQTSMWTVCVQSVCRPVPALCVSIVYSVCISIGIWNVYLECIFSVYVFRVVGELCVFNSYLVCILS